MNERTNEERPDKIEFEKNSYKIVDIGCKAKGREMEKLYNKRKVI